MDLLGLSRVGVHDNFFASGGDSILSIQLIARAQRAGLREGSVPLTPVQLEFFQQHPGNPHHFNTSILLESRIPLEVGRLVEAFKELALHHDALRMRFREIPSGWDQYYADPEEPFPGRPALICPGAL
jgi:hypothetical protein